jgi:hypothetical protein
MGYVSKVQVKMNQKGSVNNFCLQTKKAQVVHLFCTQQLVVTRRKK